MAFESELLNAAVLSITQNRNKDIGVIWCVLNQHILLKYIQIASFLVNLYSNILK